MSEPIESNQSASSGASPSAGQPALPPSARRRRRRANRIGYLFASPWLIGFFGLMLLPMIASLLLSFCEWSGLRLAWAGDLEPGEDLAGRIQWVGLENYREAWGDDLVWRSLVNTAYYALISVPAGLVVALLLAVLLNQKLKGINFFRTIFYMPHVIGGVATIMMWMWVFNPEFGLLNNFLRFWADRMVDVGLLDAGYRLPDWIYGAETAKDALILMSIWASGGAMLIFLAALQNVPEQLYEAAEIDGAGKVRQFFHVTVPQISPAIFFNLVMGVITSFQVFNEAYIMTNGGGGQDNALLFYVLYLYNNAFNNFRMGYASALVWILFVIVLVFTLLIVRSSKAWVYYEGEAS